MATTPSAQYSLMLRQGRQGDRQRRGTIGAVDLVGAQAGHTIRDIHVVVVGLGAAGTAVANVLLEAGVRHVIGCDSRGAVHVQRADYLEGNMSPIKPALAQRTNQEHRDGTPEGVIEGTDLLIGLSGPGVIPASALARMNPDPIVFAMANPHARGLARGGAAVRADPRYGPL